MTNKIDLTPLQRKMVDTIYLKDKTILQAIVDLNKLRAESKTLKADLLNKLQQKSEYTNTSPDDPIMLVGMDNTLYLSRDIRKSSPDLEGIIKHLDKKKMLQVFSLSVKKLVRIYPKLWAEYVKMEFTGTRRFMLDVNEADSDGDSNGENAEAEGDPADAID